MATKMKQCSMVGGPHDGDCYEIPVEWDELLIAEKQVVRLTEEEDTAYPSEVPIIKYKVPVVERNGKLFLDYYSKVQT